MSQPKCSEDDFIRLWGELGGAAALSRHLECSERAVHERRRAIEVRRGVSLTVGAPVQKV